MNLPKVKESCCGCTLETGTKIIGYVHLVISCVLFLFIGTLLAVQSTIPEEEVPLDSPPTEQPQDVRRLSGWVTSKQFGLVVNSFSDLAPALVGVTSILLLIGAKKKMPYLLLPWLLGMTILILVYIGLLILFIYILLTEGSLEKHFLSVFIKIGVSSYCYLVVFSFYKELRENSNESYVC